jgi:hypothetical protein
VIGSLLDVIKVSGSVVFSILFEWWIVFFFLLMSEVTLGFWVLWLIDFQRFITGPLVILSAAVFLAIPLRERYIVDKNSVFQRCVDWLKDRGEMLRKGYR